jgi:hypothetical protein
VLDVRPQVTRGKHLGIDDRSQPLGNLDKTTAELRNLVGVVLRVSSAN